MKLEFFRQIFEKSSNLKLHQNPPSGSRVVPCGHTDMTKLVVTFRNFANAPKNVNVICLYKRETPSHLPYYITLFLRHMLETENK
jgi:hypothetical protein